MSSEPVGIARPTPGAVKVFAVVGRRIVSSEQVVAAPAGPSAVPHALRPATVLAAHVLSTVLYATLFANSVWLMPLLVRLEFGHPDANWRDWQTTLVTATVPTLMMTSIFWGELLGRIRLRLYLSLFWLVAVLPLGLVALAQNYWQFFACHAVACVGAAAWTPVSGKLLQHFYADAIRGRAYAALNAVTLLAGLASAYAVGAWLERDPQAFRWYLPAAAAIQLGTIATLYGLARRMGVTDGAASGRGRRKWSDLLRPVLHMGRVLRGDRTFRLYEAAFMTYGGAYMFCDAILPVLATDRLGMGYQDFAHATQVVARFATLAAILPMGLLMDRIGPMRTSSLAFVMLGAYPLLLLAAGGPTGVAAASLVWGVAMAGVQMGWMLGPVSLAPSPDRVPQYVAIHATLVGVRGALFQGLGMAAYKLTGSFAVPLVVAALAFGWAAWQMRRLYVESRTSG